MSPEYYVSVALDFFCVLISIVLLVFLLTTEYKKTRLNRLFTCIVIFSMIRYFCDTLAWLLIGNTAWYSYIIHSIAEFLNYFFQYFLLGVYADYVITYIRRKAAVPPVIMRAIYGMCGVAIVLLIISQFNHMYYYIDENNIYYRQKWFLLSQSFQFIGLFAHIGILIRYKNVFNKRELFSLLTYMALPILGTVAQGLFYGLPFGNVLIMLATLVIYMGIQSEQVKLLKQQELELTSARIDVMLSQIQPHFLFNTLNTIENLCRKDGQLAAELVQNFAKYLRDNMESLKQKTLVPFSRELEHIQIYLDIEKLRFEERLNVVFDFETTDIYLPILTVQPLIENAVRHGVTKKTTGGIITVSTRREPEWDKIIVTDDGVGFVTDTVSELPNNDGRSHVGIENVRSRLAAQCGGTLAIESVKGVGTTATIAIPRRRHRDE